jgi:hypothetical protein
MQLLSTLFVIVPLALASPTARGCGTIVDKTGLGRTLVGDDQCMDHGSFARSWSIGRGCMCVGFDKPGCSETKRETWSSLTQGPAVNIDVEKNHVRYYKCMTDIKEREVSAAA